MLKSDNLEEQEELDDYETFAARNDSSTGDITKMDGRGFEPKQNAHRSKHSETEQRRRSKINERFQILMRLIPPKDQKRDKASFLLEVIQYIQYLQEKLQLYEGIDQGWNQGPPRLFPWGDSQRLAENVIPQGLRNWPAHYNNVVSQALPPHTQDPMESDINPAAAYKALDHMPVTNDSSVASHMKTEANVSACIGQNHISPQILAQSASDIDEGMCGASDFWQVRRSEGSAAVPNEINEWGYPAIDSEPGNLSSFYSQGVANALTQAFQSSGVDLSQTKISVDLNVVRGASRVLEGAASASKDDGIQNLKNQLLSEEQRLHRESNQALKRIRR